ncbi:glycosyltransferase [Marinobacter lipolyticus SM19]|uniref:Glycosyltransferase n=1 Tax=Marinobacter lipolyticus SM19 TaxID=1318628 RepID=R8AWE2_9GAMM|nr:glycosyltransferase [Marinobacter lipolyticus]EON90650.1 glycosyltransferase [Marinobacter lipolyticus SM19]
MTHPLTIALILATPGSGWGGMEKHTAELSAALANRGHQIHVLAHPSYQNRFSDTVTFHPLPFQFGRRNPWLKFRLRRLLNSIRPDIAHAQGNKAASLLSAARNASGATVGTVHGTKTSHKAFQQLDGVIGVSREILNSIEHRNKQLIYNGLGGPPTGENYCAGDTLIPIPEDRPLLLAAGRIEPVKQFDRLIRAWADASPPGKLVILGDGRERPTLLALVKELAMEERILLPGYETHMHPWLKAASACVISSSREGFPYIMVESLLAHCPVLSTPVSGVGDFLPESCLADSDRIGDLANLLTTHLNSSVPLRELQTNSFTRAATTLTLNAMTDQTEQFYRKLTDAPSSGHE